MTTCYSRECSQGQQSPPRPALTSDLGKAVTSRVNETGPPPAGHGAAGANAYMTISLTPAL